MSWSEYDERLPERFDMQGTYDYAPWIAAPESLRVLDELDWPVRRTQLSAMIDEGAKVIAKALGTGIAQIAHQTPTMRLVELPSTVDLTAREAIKERVSRDLKAEITLTGFDNRGFIRLSIHAYNSLQDYRVAGRPLAGVALKVAEGPLAVHRQLGQYGGRVAGLDQVEQLAVSRDMLVEIFVVMLARIQVARHAEEQLLLR